jgi:nucleoside-diphosphate-sugar epimerase
MTKILVCGADGFIGRNIVEYFHKQVDYDVFGTYHLSERSTKQNILKGDHFLGVDLTRSDHVQQLFNRVQPDIVIQAAANSSGVKDILSNPAMHVTDTLVMNALVTRACYDYNVKHFIFLSCGVMYQPGDIPKKETDFNEHDEIYPAYFGGAWMKVYTEKACEFFSRLGRTKHTVIRHSNTYGPYDKFDPDHSHFFGANIRKIAEAHAGDTITVWGNGEETSRDLLYVSDVVSLINLALQKQETPFELVNAGSGKAYTVKEVVENMVSLSGKDLKIVYDASQPVIPTKLALDSTKAKEIFGWEPIILLRAGILATLLWYERHIKGH